jgi:hypothetical protein
MRSIRFIALVLSLAITQVFVQAQIFRPYKCGPVLKKDGIQTFDSLNQYLAIKPGDVFAEIGASSGYYNGAMAVYLDNVTFYLQDIDRTCLNQENLTKVLGYYSKFRETPITATNKFHIVIGTETSTNLPRDSIDIIYSNATYHALDYPDSIVADLHKSLKTTGVLAIRDEFVYDGKLKYCQDKKCKNPLAFFEDFSNTLAIAGFELIDKTDQFGYPVYKFRKQR